MWPRRDGNLSFVKSRRSIEISYGSCVLFWLLEYNQDCVNDISSVERYENCLLYSGTIGCWLLMNRSCILCVDDYLWSLNVVGMIEKCEGPISFWLVIGKAWCIDRGSTPFRFTLGKAWLEVPLLSEKWLIKRGALT